MSKITPQDYIKSQPELARAGFQIIKAKLHNMSIDKIAEQYGVSQDVVELVKLSGGVTEFETIVRLETERLDEQKKRDELQYKKPMYIAGDQVEPKHDRYNSFSMVASYIIVIGLIALIVLGLVSLVKVIF